MSAKHTPGPWSYPRYPNGVSTLVYAAAGGKPEAFPVASATYGVPDEEREANARLIAAAPELLETLETLLSLHDARVDTADAWNVSMEEARAVIAKAVQS